MDRIAILRGFWIRFTRDELYGLGYADAVQGSGASTVSSAEEMRDACIYLTGYANAMRLANTYAAPAWYVAHLVSVAAGTLRLACEDVIEPEVGPKMDVLKITNTYVTEFTALLVELDAARGKLQAARDDLAAHLLRTS